MTSSKSPVTFCIPAHILDANISPRAREVLMLLASQTTAQHPATWVRHAAIAERLRCSAVTVKRAIQKLVEAKLIDETGDLHERRYKFYRVRWSLKEKRTVSRCVMSKKEAKPRPVKLEEPKFTQIEHPELTEKPKRSSILKPTEAAPIPHPGVNHVELLKDSRIAYWAGSLGKSIRRT